MLSHSYEFPLKTTNLYNKLIEEFGKKNVRIPVATAQKGTQTELEMADQGTSLLPTLPSSPKNKEKGQEEEFYSQYIS